MFYILLTSLRLPITREVFMLIFVFRVITKLSQCYVILNLCNYHSNTIWWSLFTVFIEATLQSTYWCVALLSSCHYECQRSSSAYLYVTTKGTTPHSVHWLYFFYRKAEKTVRRLMRERGDGHWYYYPVASPVDRYEDEELKDWFVEKSIDFRGCWEACTKD